MDRKLLTEMMNDLVESDIIPDDRPAALGAMIFEILLSNWDGISDEARGILLAISGMLMKDATRTLAEAKAKILMAKIQNKIPTMEIDGKEVILADHELTFQVARNDTSGKWFAACPAIDMKVVADDYPSLKREVFERIGERAVQSGVARGADTTVINFKMA